MNYSRHSEVSSTEISQNTLHLLSYRKTQQYSSLKSCLDMIDRLKRVMRKLFKMLDGRGVF